MMDYERGEQTCGSCGVYHPSLVGPVLIDGSIRFRCTDCRGDESAEGSISAD